jgi:hypothetical protein
MKLRRENGLGRISEEKLFFYFLEIVLFISKIDTPMPLKALKNDIRYLSNEAPKK